jgi:hypothetical protein
VVGFGQAVLCLTAALPGCVVQGGGRGGGAASNRPSNKQQRPAAKPTGSKANHNSGPRTPVFC